MRRFKGYSRPQRQDLLLLLLGLNEKHIILYRLILEVIVDWDSRHDGYGTFQLDYEGLSYFLNWSEGKTRRIYKDLCEYGFIFLIDKKREIYEVTGYRDQKTEGHVGSHAFCYLENLLDAVLKKSDKALYLKEKYKDFVQYFPILEKRGKSKGFTERKRNSKYSGNIVSSSGKSSLVTKKNDDLSEEDKEFIEEMFK